jgi:hypothetical protein
LTSGGVAKTAFGTLRNLAMTGLNISDLAKFNLKNFVVGTHADLKNYEWESDK